jgi:hypothetical protein
MSGIVEGSKMKLWKDDVPGESQTLPSPISDRGSRQPVHRGPVRLKIRVLKVECVLADIQAKIKRLRQEMAYLKQVRGELAGVEAKP